jgi:hypothetical protein
MVPRHQRLRRPQLLGTAMPVFRVVACFESFYS